MLGLASPSIGDARLVGLAAACSYVASVYVGKTARGDRDTQSTIVRRMLNISSTTAAWCFWAANSVPAPLCMSLVPLGPVLRACAGAAALTATLFMGPLASRVWAEKHERGPSSLIMGLRDYVVGPLTEELVFRGVCGAVYAAAGASTRQCAVEPALLFALAHVHHIANLRKQGAPWLLAVAATAAHALMTFVFGLYAGFLLISTNSVWPSFLAHALANYAGPPEVGRPGAYRASLVVGLAGFAGGCMWLQLPAVPTY